MVSIIISSPYSEITSLAKNINETISEPYELIWIENPQRKYNLSQAYNLGASKAQYPILCFIHDDVLFAEKNWGKVLVQLFEDPNVGLVGVSGSKHASLLQAGWWGYSVERYHRYSIFHSTNKGSEQMLLNPDNEDFTKVVVLDGVFLATRHSIWKEILFDEQLTGFHGYDIDFSINVSTRFDVLVSYQIPLIHSSRGKIDNNWLEANFKVFKKWKNSLPLNILKESKSVERNALNKNLQFLMYTLIYNSLNKWELSKIFIRYSLTFGFNMKLFRWVGNYVLLGRKENFLIKQLMDSLYEK